jgi:hypothetical protein
VAKTITLSAESSVLDLISNLRPLYACVESIEWLESLPPDTTFAQVWAQCERGDWMLWLAGRRKGVDRKLLVLAACDVAEPALQHVRAGEERPAEAIESARRWARGEAPTSASHAAAAAHASYCAPTSASHVASHAAYAAAYSAAAPQAAHAAAFDAACASYADDDEAHKASLKRSADLVRARIPLEQLLG